MHGNLEPEENPFWECTPEDARISKTGLELHPPTWKDKLDEIAKEIGGTIEHTATLNSMGRSSQKIVIEYNIQEKKK